MIYHFIKNLSSSTTETTGRADRLAEIKEIPTDITSKHDRIVWAKRPDTDHAFISTFEGVNAGVRVNPREGNPVYRMHGLIADYDTYAPSNVTIKQVLQRHFASSPELMPTWVVATRSGGRRLIWEFSEPIGMDAGRICEEFIKGLRKELKLHALLAGLDEGALTTPSTYYEIGSAWEKVSDIPIPAGTLAGIFCEAALKAAKVISSTGSLPEIPMPNLYKEIETRWPGALARPEEQFTEGCRCQKFWEGGGNPTACIVQRHGIYCFSTDKIFHSWREILGDSFVTTYERDRIGVATENLYYFGRGSFCRVAGTDDYPKFIALTKDEVKDYLKVTCGLNPKKANEIGGSEIDRAIQAVHEVRHVLGRAPFLWNPNRMVESMGSKYLNDCLAKVTPPADGDPGRWGEGFEWTADWLMHLFEPRTQLVRLLAWMQRAYVSAYEHSPAPSLGLFLVGSTNLGKTLWNQKWWPHIMGGGMEATKYLLGETNFLKVLAQVPHWYVDDAKASVNERESQTFTEAVKAFVANPMIEYRPLYVDSVPLEYHGTLCVTMNEDDQSLQMLPSLDRSIIDKVLILKCARGGNETVFTRFREKFGVNAPFDAQLKKEAPAFLRWLRAWEPPARIAKNVKNRFGVSAWVHPSLLNASVVNSSAGDLLAVIDMLMEVDAQLEDEVKANGYYDCTSLQLLNVITTNPCTNRLLGSFGNSARGIGMRLAKLAKLHGSRVVNLREKGRQTKAKGEATTYRLFPAVLSTKAPGAKG